MSLQIYRQNSIEFVVVVPDELGPFVNKRAIDRDKKSSGPRMRLFCALHPTMDEARLLSDPLDSLEPLPDHRRTVIDQIHMTVLFIGEVARKT